MASICPCYTDDGMKYFRIGQQVEWTNGRICLPTYQTAIIEDIGLFFGNVNIDHFYLRWISIKDLISFLPAVFHTNIGIDNLIMLIPIKAP